MKDPPFPIARNPAMKPIPTLKALLSGMLTVGLGVSFAQSGIPEKSTAIAASDGGALMRKGHAGTTWVAVAATSRR